MKKLILLLLLAVCEVFVMSAKNQEIVYLKNGSIIRGTVIELIPDISVRIQTRDGSVFVYDMSEVEKIVKEGSSESSLTQIGPVGSEGFLGFKGGKGSGYRGLMDMGYTIGVGTFGEGRFELNMVNSYQFVPNVSFGLGVGLNYYFDSKLVALPIYADFRAGLNNSISPFGELRIGGSVVDVKGFYLNASLGLRWSISGTKNAITMSVGYTVQQADVYIIVPALGYNATGRANVGGVSVRAGFEI